MTRLKRIARAGFERLESGFDAVFTPAWNPFYQLGALGWFFYWIVAASGFYLYIFFDSGVTQAYESVEHLTHTQWYAGGVMRSLHRYASDALVVVMLIHLVREFVLDRYHGPRSFAWIIGIPILWLVYASGVTGYWIVWDQLAQYIAIATSEWFDTLPFFGEPIARNFAHESNLSGRFFTLMIFIHIAVPLILLFVMWIHIQRSTHPKVNPPKGLALGSLATLVVLSLLHPALSQAPANLDQVPAVVGLDWFYLGVYPLLDHWGGLAVWVLLGAASLLLLAVPWLPPRARGTPAVVDPGNCNGCGRCVADCPYNAVTLGGRTDGAPFSQQALVIASKCVSCGICAGACPTSTPYRRRSALIPGIDLPGLRLGDLRSRIRAAADRLSDEVRVIVFGCDAGATLENLQSDGVAVLTLPCIGHLPPPFIDFILSRGLADGVFLTGCRDGDCFHRLGIEWTRARLAGTRDPYLRSRVPRERIATFWAGIDRDVALEQELKRFRERLTKHDEPGRRPRPTPGASLVERSIPADAMQTR